MRRYSLLTSVVSIMTILSSCTTHTDSGENPLLMEWETPFGVPPFEQIEAKHFLPALDTAFVAHTAQIEAITSSGEPASFESVILAYDNSGALLSEIYTIYSMLSSAETTPELQAIEEEISTHLTLHTSKIELNEALFDKVRTVYDNRAAEGLDAEQLRLTEKIYTSFVRGGALLSPEDKERMRELSEEISLLEVRFGQNLLAENNNFRLVLSKGDLDGLSTSQRNAAKEAAAELGIKDKWVITLQAPSWIPFMTSSKNRKLREELYRGYISRGNNDDEFDNKQIVADLTRLRAEQATLLGFESYADYVVSNQMAGKVAKVYDLLGEIWDPALESAKEELRQMQALFKKDHPREVFESWDWWYYAEAVRKKNYNFDEDEIRPYLSLSNVQNGIFMLANRLYGITFRPVALPHYHEECSAYEVLDVDNSHIGILYFDYHPRPGKSQGAWCGNYRELSYENGERIAPVVSIVCNFTRPSGNNPALLSVDETKTLFHEFGHALHFLFHDVKYRGLSEVEGDFVELPSQIMENWAMEPELLRRYALHHRTQKMIPDALIEKLNRSALFNQGFMTTELVAAALSDLDIHSIGEYFPFDVEEFEQEALNVRRGLIPQIEPRYHYTYFAHIFAGGYSAGYYFYLWAEVLDKDAFNAFKLSGDLFNKKMADSFRRNILERGGSEDGMSMYTKFRGAEPDKDPMLFARGLKTIEPEQEPTEELTDDKQSAERPNRTPRPATKLPEKGKK